ncbi:NAD(P)/FAD-dependent oxidoreductase [Pararhodospirillum photometricum]|nr:FAD-dependent oxidoreductase [Pararhodospirillum photometricum]
MTSSAPLNIAVIGSGIAGMAAAWLLAKRHTVTVLEKDFRPGGHTNTVEAPLGKGARVPVDAGFILYNESNYRNLSALFAHLGVPTQAADLSFSVSIDDGRVEYARNNGLVGLLAQPTNLVKPRFWSMLRGWLRFYREAPAFLKDPQADTLTLAQYLLLQNYPPALVEDHLLPLGAAVWSCPPQDMEAHPAAAFIRFFQSHGLLSLRPNPGWRTVTGGAREYLQRLTAPYVTEIKLHTGAKRLIRCAGGVLVEDERGGSHLYDHVVVATHAPQALALLDEPTPDERRLLSPFHTRANEVWLHQDLALMPHRAEAWAAWNALVQRQRSVEWTASVTTWLNHLHGFDRSHPLFLSLNPPLRPDAEGVLGRMVYHHPLITLDTLAARKELWKLQGQGNIWYCGAWCGDGFHEDGLQAALWVAERLGHHRRPWSLPEPSDRLTGWPESLP